MFLGIACRCGQTLAVASNTMARKAEWQRALLSGQAVSLIRLDIDYFKQCNDSYGHLGGDDCLRMVSTVLREKMRRPSDLVARYVGEEFAILLPDTCGARRGFPGRGNCRRTCRAVLAARFLSAGRANDREHGVRHLQG